MYIKATEGLVLWRLCTLYMHGMPVFAEKIKYSELRKFNVKLYTLYIYKMVGFAEKLIIQNCGNSMGNCVHYTYEMSGFAEKLNIPNS